MSFGIEPMSLLAYGENEHSVSVEPSSTEREETNESRGEEHSSTFLPSAFRSSRALFNDDARTRGGM